VRALRAAEDIHPTKVRRDAMVRDTLAVLLRHSRQDAVGQELRGMARRAGLRVQPIANPPVTEVSTDPADATAKLRPVATGTTCEGVHSDQDADQLRDASPSRHPRHRPSDRARDRQTTHPARDLLAGSPRLISAPPRKESPDGCHDAVHH
jgi:hypothetical protein